MSSCGDLKKDSESNIARNFFYEMRSVVFNSHKSHAYDLKLGDLTQGRMKSHINGMEVR